ncbi:MAG: hypothetical protein OEW45_12270, partial [Deltaproteobacteria bacterium]|nr:hypothetical protein [Deltaproteobacteria bacterium]
MDRWNGYGLTTGESRNAFEKKNKGFQDLTRKEGENVNIYFNSQYCLGSPCLPRLRPVCRPQ